LHEARQAKIRADTAKEVTKGRWAAAVNPTGASERRRILAEAIRADIMAQAIEETTAEGRQAKQDLLDAEAADRAQRAQVAEHAAAAGTTAAVSQGIADTIARAISTFGYRSKICTVKIVQQKLEIIQSSCPEEMAKLVYSAHVRRFYEALEPNDDGPHGRGDFGCARGRVEALGGRWRRWHHSLKCLSCWERHEPGVAGDGIAISGLPAYLAKYDAIYAPTGAFVAGYPAFAVGPDKHLFRHPEFHRWIL
jgi:hypothetical protein